MISLFAYGTLRAPELLAAVLGHPAKSVDAVARGYRTVYYPGRTYPALIAAPGRVARGALVADLTADDLRLLDQFEGDEYERRTIKVRVESRLTSAEVYWPLADIAATAPQWHYDEWRARHAGSVLTAQGATGLRERLIAEGGGPLPTPARPG